MSDTPLPPGMRDVALGGLLAAWSTTLYENPVDVEIYQHGTRINGRPPLSETEVYDLLRKRVIELSIPNGSDTDEPTSTPVRAPNDPLLNVAETLLAVRDDVRELLKRVPVLSDPPRIEVHAGAAFLEVQVASYGPASFPLFSMRGRQPQFLKAVAEALGAVIEIPERG